MDFILKSGHGVYGGCGRGHCPVSSCSPNMHLSNERYLFIISTFIFLFHHADDRGSPIPPLVKPRACYKPIMCNWVVWEYYNTGIAWMFVICLYLHSFGIGRSLPYIFAVFISICFFSWLHENHLCNGSFFLYVLRQICHCRIYLNYSNKNFSSIMEYEANLLFHDTFSLFLSIFYISQRLTLWYFVFLYLIFLSQQVLYFLLSTLVLTLYIDVVLSLSIKHILSQYLFSMFYFKISGQDA